LDQEKALIASYLAHFLVGQLSKRALIGVSHDVPTADADRQVASRWPMLTRLAFVNRASSIEQLSAVEACWPRN